MFVFCLFAAFCLLHFALFAFLTFNAENVHLTTACVEAHLPSSSAKAMLLLFAVVYAETFLGYTEWYDGEGNGDGLCPVRSHPSGVDDCHHERHVNFKSCVHVGKEPSGQSGYCPSRKLGI